jgi:DNA-binding MarR family transcriptional regulator
MGSSHEPSSSSARLDAVAEKFSTFEEDLRVTAKEIRDAIAELALIDERRPLVEATLTGLRRLSGEPLPRAASPKAPRAMKTDGRTDGRSKGLASVTPHRSLPDDADRATQILEVLSAKRSMKPAELAAAVGLSVPHLRGHVNGLIERQLVEASGATLNRRFSLTLKGAGAKVTIAPTPAGPVPVAQKSAPAPSPAPAAAAPTSDASLVEARDAAIKSRLKQGKASFDQLLAALPHEAQQSADEKSTACKKAIRRLVLRGVVADVGDKFQLV